ncbi:MAG: pilus assembly protein [Anaerolineales bacterium]|nr:pilus assembly protein [Anaerolineales bacterium]
MRKSKLQHSRGQSLVETALAIPILLLLILTFIDLGRAIYYYSALQNAVREGARFASVNNLEDHASETDVVNVVTGYSIAVDIADSDVTVVALDGSGAIEDDVTPIVYTDDTEKVTVSASIDFAPITPFLAQMLGSGNTITLTAETTMTLSPIAR